MSEQPRRIQLSRAKGWKMPENTVKVDRSTKWGNPFFVGVHGDQAKCVLLFSELAEKNIFLADVEPETFDAQVELNSQLRKHLGELHGKNLACWCRLDQKCHADVLLELANK